MVNPFRKLHALTFIYAKMSRKPIVYGNNVSIDKSSSVINSYASSQIIVGHNTKLVGFHIKIEAENARVIVGNNCYLTGIVVLKAPNTTAIIGDKTSIRGILLSMHESGKITIGEDCMFSSGIRMDNSDMHSIVDIASGQRINPAKDISIGNHVWLGMNVTVLKGSEIGHNSIIGAGGIVTGFIQNDSLAVGNPAKVIKNGVTWDRRLL